MQYGKKYVQHVVMLSIYAAAKGAPRADPKRRGSPQAALLILAAPAFDKNTSFHTSENRSCSVVADAELMRCGMSCKQKAVSPSLPHHLALGRFLAAPLAL